MRIIAVILILGLTACSSSSLTNRPIGISKSINGLKQSQCNCGGLETKEEAKARAGRPVPSAASPQAQTTSLPNETQSIDKD